MIHRCLGCITAAAVLLLFLLVYPAAAASNRYHNYEEMSHTIDQLVSKHKQIATLESIGKTLAKRDVWVFTVGGKDASERPAVVVVGGVEANRIIGSELALHFIEFLLTNYGKVDSITQLVNTTTFYIIPRVNPDAAEAFFDNPKYERMINTRRVDTDKDGKIDEDGFEDLNNDGLITMMRVSDNRGEWIVPQEDNRLMRKADPAKGERGAYKLYTEGIDNDKDEQWNEDGPGGVDFNRNFTHNYAYFGEGAGPHQISEAETRAVAEFTFAHPNIAAVFTFSSNDNLNNPWKADKPRGTRNEKDSMEGDKEDEGESSPRFIRSVMEDDEEYFAQIAKQFQEVAKIKGAPRSAKGEGAFSEWAYFHFGRWSFAAYPWWPPVVEEKKDTASNDTTRRGKAEGEQGKKAEEKPDALTDQLKTLKWIDAAGFKDAFVSWSPIKHTDFPDRTVEVGGFRPYVLTNPPADSILGIAGKFNDFLALLGRRLASIDIQNINVERIEERIFRVQADIVNTGYLPTNSAMAVKAVWPRNVKVSLKLSKDQSLASGKAINILQPIRGSGGSNQMSWLVVSPPGGTIELTAESPTAGSATQTIKLK